MNEPNEKNTNRKDNDEIIIARSDKSQILEYENPLFPCVLGKSFYTPDMTCHITEHWHEELEFLYVLEGHLDYGVHGEHIRVNEGEGFIVNSRRIHSNISKKGDYCVLNYGLLHPSCIRTSSYLDQKYLHPMISPNSFHYIHLKKDDWTSEILNEMCPLFDDTGIEGRELLIIQVCLKVLDLIFRNLPPNTEYNGISAEYVRTFKEMVSFINEHYSEKMSLEDIAASGNIGKTLCSKIFKKLTDKTPGDYLISYRINKSIELLDENEMSITDIAYATGFNSASHYTKTFHEMIGCTPNKYRHT